MECHSRVLNIAQMVGIQVNKLPKLMEVKLDAIFMGTCSGIFTKHSALFGLTKKDPWKSVGS